MVILCCRRGGGPRAVRVTCSRSERHRCGLGRARGLVALLRRRDLSRDEAIGPTWSMVGGWRDGRCAGPAQLASRKVGRDEILSASRWVRVSGVNKTRVIQPWGLRVGVE